MNKIIEIVQNANRLSEVGYVLPQKKYYNRKGKRPGVCKYYIFQYVENEITKNIYIRKDDLADVKKLVRDKKREFKKLNKESEDLLNAYKACRDRIFIEIETIKYSKIGI